MRTALWLGREALAKAYGDFFANRSHQIEQYRLVRAEQNADQKSSDAN